jgi:hypothetical protein
MVRNPAFLFDAKNLTVNSVPVDEIEHVIAGLLKIEPPLLSELKEVLDN